MFSLGMSNTSASLYVGFSVFFLMDVFLFFSLRPSQMSEAFTYGSVGGAGGGGGGGGAGEDKEGGEADKERRQDKTEEGVWFYARRCL